jgi:sulfoxide reductase heme-binding subunit YedZ
MVVASGAKQSRMLHRLMHHYALLAPASGASVGVLYWLVGATYGASRSNHLIFGLSIATGYVALALLVATLAIGPINLLRRRRNPISTDLRRDLGIWCAVLSLAHFMFGWNVHMQNRLDYFFREAGAAPTFVPRTDLFGFANYTGLIAILIVIVLLLISNDYALRRFGARRWKSLQRWNYALALLVILHAVAYEIIEKRQLKFVAFFAVMILSASILQALGFQRMQQKNLRRPLSAS